MECEVKVSGNVSVGEKTDGPEAGVGRGAEPLWRNHGLAAGACPFGGAIGGDPSCGTPGARVGEVAGETIGVVNDEAPDPRVDEFGVAGLSASGS